MGDRAKMDEATQYAQELPGFKRSNPQYFADPMIDRLLEVILMMGGEMWTLRHRQAIAEKLAAQGQPATSDMIETFVADDDFRASMELERQDLIRRMYAPLKEGDFADPREAGLKWIVGDGDKGDADKDEQAGS